MMPNDAFVIVSVLGNYLRKDGEDFTPELREAKRFGTSETAENVIVSCWGKQGKRAFHVAYKPIKDTRKDDDNGQ